MLQRWQCQQPEKSCTIRELAEFGIMCCPEDHTCCRKDSDCVARKVICDQCRVPVCGHCYTCITASKPSMPARVLTNDNFIGYIDPWMMGLGDEGITWMEKLAASRFWTTLFTVTIDAKRKYSKKKHTMGDTMYEQEHRVQFKGQVFSAPLDWETIMEQLQRGETEAHVMLPVRGEALAARVRIIVSAGLLSLNKLIAGATVRRNVVIALITHYHNIGHPDYQCKRMMADLKENTAQMTSGDHAEIPAGLVDLLDAEAEAQPLIGTDKAAIPAERHFDTQNLQRDLERSRPLILVPQRESDAFKKVELSRIGAFGKHADLELRVGSNLEPQFNTLYIPRVYPMVFPFVVGGPDFPQGPRPRRDASAPRLCLSEFTAIMSARPEYQIRGDWEFCPGLWSLNFASRVNRGVSFGITRAVQKNDKSFSSGAEVRRAAARIYLMLQHGEYVDSAGVRRPVKGDLSKMHSIVGGHGR